LAKSLMHRHRLERVLVVNGDHELRGLITVRTSRSRPSIPMPARTSSDGCAWSRDQRRGRQRGARELLVAAGVDVLVVDTPTAIRRACSIACSG